jgi:hypothetical protein
MTVEYERNDAKHDCLPLVKPDVRVARLIRLRVLSLPPRIVGDHAQPWVFGEKGWKSENVRLHFCEKNQKSWNVVDGQWDSLD